MFDLKLPALNFSLPRWHDRDLTLYQEHTEKLRQIASEAGEATNGIKIRANQILRNLSLGASLPGQINSGKDIRALLMLWLHYNDDGCLFSGKARPDTDLFERFNHVRPRLSKLALYDFSQVYFKYFDQFPKLETLCKYLRAQFALQAFQGADSSLSRMGRNTSALFCPQAPSLLVERTVKLGKTLHEVLEDAGIPESDGLFRERCTLLYYISRLEQLNLGEDDELFAEILQEKVLKTPFRDGLLIGHAVLKILIGKAIRAGKVMPENWLKIILTIAGDPRVPSSSSSYQVWWSRLESSTVDQVRAWLSRFDLDLFLNAFEEYAKHSGDETLRRMFPARKQFLEGLFEHGIIANTRLFIGRHAIQFLKQNYDARELPMYAHLNHKDKSIIYLEVAGFHVIEGSHSAKFWIFDRLPENSKVLDYNEVRFSQSELGADLERAYYYDYDDMPFEDIPIGIVHHPNVTWQHKAISHLEELGITLDVEKLLTPEDYKSYKGRFGLSYY